MRLACLELFRFGLEVVIHVVLSAAAYCLMHTSTTLIQLPFI